jgi:hypothetical protein
MSTFHLELVYAKKTLDVARNKQTSCQRKSPDRMILSPLRLCVWIIRKKYIAGNIVTSRMDSLTLIIQPVQQQFKKTIPYYSFFLFLLFPLLNTHRGLWACFCLLFSSVACSLSWFLIYIPKTLTYKRAEELF